MVTNPPANAGGRSSVPGLGRSLGWEDPLEEEMATHSSMLAWKIPQTKQPSGLQSMLSQRVGYNLVIKQPQSIKLHRRFIKVTLEIHVQYLTVSHL